MKVLQLVTTEAPFFTKQVEALEARGVDCTVRSLPRRNGDTRSVGAYATLYADVLRTVGDEFDLVHANYGLVGPLALAQPRRPVVLSLWGSEVMGAAGWLDRLSAWAARHSDAVVAPSAAVAEHLDCEHRLIPFGVDTDLFEPRPRAEARERLGWSDEERVVLFPYPPERTVKDYPRAQRVVARTNERVPEEVTLKTISGVPYEAVARYMNASDAVLVTSRRESGPMVVKEAAACNVPVVSTDVGFVADALDGVPNSFVCRSSDALVEGLTAALRAERPTGPPPATTDIDEMGDRLLDVYRSVLGRRPPAEVARVER